MSAVRIENWAVVAKRGAADQPGLPAIHLRGVVTGHPTYQDGTEITTSHLTHRSGTHFVTCNGTHYELGEPDPVYLLRFPNAREDLVRRLPNRATEETIVLNRPTE